MDLIKKLMATYFFTPKDIVVSNINDIIIITVSISVVKYAHIHYSSKFEATHGIF